MYVSIYILISLSGLPVIVIEDTEAVLLGSAILAATASGIQVCEALYFKCPDTS